MGYENYYLDLKRRLYQYYKNFKKFQGFELEDFDKIKENIGNLDGDRPMDRYTNMLKRLTCNHFYSYDEKIASLLMACDPNFFSLTLFEEAGCPEKDTEEFREYETKVREQIGFFDGNFKVYEAYYRRRIEQLQARRDLADTLVKKLNK